MMQERIRVLDVPVDLVGAEGALERVETAINQRSPLHIVTLNAEMAVLSRTDEVFRGIVQRSGLVLPDGSGVVWAARRAKIPIAKLAGVDFLLRVAQEAARKGWKIYFLGAKPEVVRTAVERLKERIPGLPVAGFQDGYFQDEAEVLAKIREARPDVLLVALGVPRQEKWIALHQAALGVPVCMGVGGSFDVFAGTVQRAPRWMQRTHLEWLFRLYREPWRWRRILGALPRFVWLVWRNGRPRREIA